MAAPTKNLVDATAPSKVAPQRFFAKSIILAKSLNISYSVQIEQPVVRFTLVQVSIRPIKQFIPLLSVGVIQKFAGTAAIKTFPSIYKERVSTRPTEGQIFPRGYK